MAERLYRISCPTCGHIIHLLGTGLSRIVQARLVPGRDEGFLMFVCGGCKVAFPCDCPKQAVAVIDEGPKTQEYRSQQCLSVVAHCARHNEGDCDDSLVELQAIRPARTDRTELLEREMPTWTLSQVLCANGHRILNPRTTQLLEFSKGVRTFQPAEPHHSN